MKRIFLVDNINATDFLIFEIYLCNKNFYYDCFASTKQYFEVTILNMRARKIFFLQQAINITLEMKIKNTHKQSKTK